MTIIIGFASPIQETLMQFQDPKNSHMNITKSNYGKAFIDDAINHNHVRLFKNNCLIKIVCDSMQI